MKTILTMPSPGLALLTMTGEGKPFVLNRRTMAELEALLDEVRRRAPRALVLTGEGRFFCAGADIREMAAMDGRELYDWALLGSRLNTNLEELLMPVDAAFRQYKSIFLSPKQSKMFLDGIRLDTNRIKIPAEGDTVRVYGDGRFLALAHIERSIAELQIIKLFYTKENPNC